MDRENRRRSFLKYLLSVSAFIAGSTLSLNKSRGFKKRKISWIKARGMETSGKRVKKIAVEEHFLTEQYLAWLGSKTEYKTSIPEGMTSIATNLGEGRLKAMDECGSGIDMQVLSLSDPPGLAEPALDPFSASDAIVLAKIINNELSEAVKQYPKRFAGLCCLPLQDPKASADELERAVTKLGLKGTMVNDNPKRWLSDQKYEVIFERLATLDVPIYIHAMGPTKEDSGLHVVPEVWRLIDSGLFDKYPGLKIILGHGGESLPFWLWRVNGVQQRGAIGRRKNFMQNFKDHFYVTTSAQFWPPLLQFLISVLGSDRILFATDYPHPDSCKHVDFIDSAQISDSDREKICHLNAERLFKL